MRILLIEDDKNLSSIIAEQLQKEGCVTDCCYDGETALACALNPDFSYDIILLDRMLPIIDGMTVLKAMRRKKIWTPVILITGLGELDDKIEGLDCGADDYLVKPFHIKELFARIRALGRRPSDVVTDRQVSAAGLTLDTGLRRLSFGSRFVFLTQKESSVLQVLMKEQEHVHTREELLWKVWGSAAEVESGNVDNYIHFLRKRLRELNCPAKIKTVYGAGYRLEEDS